MTNTLLVTESGLETVETPDEHAGAGDTLIAVSHSSMNYKDAMALDGNRGVVRTLPLVPGIDAVGTVLESPSLEEGTLVTVNGHGIGERRHGGFTPRMRIDASQVTRVPARFDAWTAAAIGTAGYTAALSVDALERTQKAIGTPAGGPILVTGPTGGVGSIALQLLSARGYETVAATGRADEMGDYLRDLGASEVIDRAELSEAGKPLQKTRFGGVVDTVGSTILANAIAQVRWGGVVTACGMAAGNDLPASVLPFILRGVHLAGVNSVDAPTHLRDAAWELLAETLDVEKLRSFTQTVGMDDAPGIGKQLLAGTWHGRAVVEIDAD